MIYGWLKLAVIASVPLWVNFASAQGMPADWMIVPGERVGPITAATSETDLEALFGRDNIEPIEVHLGEGRIEPGTAVYPQDGARRLEVVWLNDDRKVAKDVRLTGDSSAWKTAEGISLGTSLKEIERLNGFPFRLAGFAFDYGGTITDCGRRGRLTMLGCVDRDDDVRDRLIVLRLSPSADARTLPEYRRVMGNRNFSSGHPAMQVLNPSVYQMIVYLSR